MTLTHANIVYIGTKLTVKVDLSTLFHKGCSPVRMFVVFFYIQWLCEKSEKVINKIIFN